jgi:ankyrin repeat protein
LENLDLNLDQSYARVFASIDSFPEWQSTFAKWLLPWVTCSIRPMRYEEIMEALKFSNPELTQLLDGFGEAEEMLKMFRGLIQWNQETGIVSFSHFSIKEFILSSRIDTTTAKSYRVKERIAHAEIAQSCLNIFLKSSIVHGLFSTEAKLQEALIAHPFLEYAAKSWINHAKKGQPSNSLDAAIVELLTDLQTKEDLAEYSSFAAWQQIHDYKKHWWSNFNVKFGTETPFVIAMTTERYEVVQELVDLGFHFRNTGYRVSLKTAASEGKDEIVRLLLDHGADTNETGVPGETALHLALSANHLSTARILLERGADPHFFNDSISAGSALSYAAEYSSADTMRLLLKYIDRIDVDRLGSHCGTALQKAASEGRKEIVSILIDHGADVNANLGRYGTAIHQAATGGHLNVVRFLLDRGANVNVAGGDGGSALQAAIGYRHTAIARLLIREASTDVNLDTGPHGNALQLAVSMEDNSDIVFDLLRRGAIGDSESGRFRSALESAVTNPKVHLLRELMDRFPAKLNEQDNSSRILQQAILSGHIAALAFLLERQAFVNVQDEFGWTPLLCARHIRSNMALRTLEEYIPTVLSDNSMGGVVHPTQWDKEFFAEDSRLDQDGLTIRYDCKHIPSHHTEYNANV